MEATRGQLHNLSMDHQGIIHLGVKRIYCYLNFKKSQAEEEIDEYEPRAAGGGGAASLANKNG
jgi:hypothetical protein